MAIIKSEELLGLLSLVRGWKVCIKCKREEIENAQTVNNGKGATRAD